MIAKHLFIISISSMLICAGCMQEKNSKNIDSPQTQADIKKTFKKCSQTVFSITDFSKPDPPVYQIKDIQQASDGSLTFESVGNDPQIYLPAALSLGQSTYIIKIAVTAPEVTTFQLFYKNKNDTFNGQQLILYPLKKGENEFFIRLNDPKPIDFIRVDPGQIAGPYTLSELTIRTP
jgi:hypothetical protein